MFVMAAMVVLLSSFLWCFVCQHVTQFEGRAKADVTSSIYVIQYFLIVAAWGL